MDCDLFPTDTCKDRSYTLNLSLFVWSIVESTMSRLQRCHRILQQACFAEQEGNPTSTPKPACTRKLGGAWKRIPSRPPLSARASLYLR